MPEKNSKVKFNNFHKQLQVQFVIYADFEAITENVHGCKPNNDKSYLFLSKEKQIVPLVIKFFCCYDDKYSKNKFRFTEVKMLHTNVWKKSLKKLNIVKMLLNTNSTSL